MKTLKKAEAVCRILCDTVAAAAILYMLSVLFIGRQWIPLIVLGTAPGVLVMAVLKCAAGAALLQLPLLFRRSMKDDIPNALYMLFEVFVLCATILGEVFSLYDRVALWDVMLHGVSGFMAAWFGYILVRRHAHRKNAEAVLSPLFCALCAFGFSLSIGALWEMYEFTGDSLLGMTMQRFCQPDGTLLVGQRALVDTMKDVIMDFSGALIAAVSIFLSRRKKH